MADNVTSNPGSGGMTFATNDLGGIQFPEMKMAYGAKGAVAYVSPATPLPVQVATETGAANIANAQVTVDTTSGGVTIVAFRATRRRVTIVNLGTIDVYFGVGTVSTTNGVLLKGIPGAAVTIGTTAAVKGVVASGTQLVSVLEEYD